MKSKKSKSRKHARHLFVTSSNSSPSIPFANSIVSAQSTSGEDPLHILHSSSPSSSSSSFSSSSSSSSSSSFSSSAPSNSSTLHVTINELRGFSRQILSFGYSYCYFNFAVEHLPTSGGSGIRRPASSARTILKKRTRTARISRDGCAHWFETFTFLISPSSTSSSTSSSSSTPSSSHVNNMLNSSHSFPTTPFSSSPFSSTSSSSSFSSSPTALSPSSSSSSSSTSTSTSSTSFSASHPSLLDPTPLSPTDRLSLLLFVSTSDLPSRPPLLVAELPLDHSSPSPSPPAPSSPSPSRGLSHFDHAWRPLLLSDAAASLLLAPRSPSRRDSVGSPPRSASGSFILDSIPHSPSPPRTTFSPSSSTSSISLLSDLPPLITPSSSSSSSSSSSTSSSTSSSQSTSSAQHILSKLKTRLTSSTSSSDEILSSSPSSSSSSSFSFSTTSTSSSSSSSSSSLPPPGQLNLLLLHVSQPHSPPPPSPPPLLAHQQQTTRRRKKILSCPVPGTIAPEALSWHRARPLNRFQLRTPDSIKFRLGASRSPALAPPSATRHRALTSGSIQDTPSKAFLQTDSVALLACDSTPPPLHALSSSPPVSGDLLSSSNGASSPLSSSLTSNHPIVVDSDGIDPISPSSSLMESSSPVTITQSRPFVTFPPDIRVYPPTSSSTTMQSITNNNNNSISPPTSPHSRGDLTFWLRENQINVSALMSLPLETLHQLGLTTLSHFPTLPHSSSSASLSTSSTIPTSVPIEPSVFSTSTSHEHISEDDFDLSVGSDPYEREMLDDHQLQLIQQPAAPPAQSHNASPPSIYSTAADYRTDWNARFQSISRRIYVLTKGDVNDDLAADLLQAQTDLMNLTTDFLFFVRHYGKIIITEVSTPNAHKTIKTITNTMGGWLGGDKYRVSNILFKFAGDEIGEKVAAHDLKGLQCFMNCHQPLISFPLMAILDYLGFRLVAMSILPISPRTIIHGSDNAGRRVHISEDRNLLRTLRRVASILNLKPHNLATSSTVIQQPSSPDSNQSFSFSSSLSSSNSVSSLNDTSLSTSSSSSSFMNESTSLSFINESISSSSSTTTTTTFVNDLSSSLSPLSSSSSSIPSSSSSFSSSSCSLLPSSSNETTTLNVNNISLSLEIPQFDDTLKSNDNMKFSPRSIPGIYFATDIEVHRGWDGRFYLIDFSRVLPPVTPRKSKPGAHLYELFRPEFIKKYKTSLCSDSYSKFLKNRAEDLAARRNVDEATHYLRTSLIPRVSRFLPESLKSASSVLPSHVTELLHAKGVNIRYLGLILAELIKSQQETSEGSPLAPLIAQAISLVAVEIYARAFNSLTRELLRQNTFSHATPILSEHRGMIVSSLNLLFGQSAMSLRFWGDDLRRRIVDKFEGLDAIFRHLPPFSLLTSRSEQEAHPERVLLFRRIAPRLGLKMSPEFLQDLADNPQRLHSQDRPFSQSDLLEIVERTKTLSLISHAHGYLLLNRGLLKRAQDPMSAVRCFQSAISKFQKSLKTSRNDKVVLRDFARTLVLLEEEHQRESHAMGFGDAAFHAPRIEQANRYYKKAIQVDPEDPRSLLLYAKFLQQFGRTNEAEEYFLRALEIDKDFINALYAYGYFLSAQNKEAEALQFYERARLLTNTRYLRPGIRDRQLRLSDDS